MRHTRLDGGVQILRVHRENPGHPREVNRHAAAERVDMPFERRSDAERDDRRAMPRRDPHDGADVIRIRGKDHDIRLGVGVPGLAVAVVVELRGIGRASIADDRAQIRDEAVARGRRQDGRH